jgi:recombination protein RecR
MPRYPRTIENLITSFCLLPGVGRKTAERYVFFLLKQDSESLRGFSENLFNLRRANFLCPDCFNFSENADRCDICANPKRDHETICVVESIQDLSVIEGTGEYPGIYHVLHGKLDPIEGMTPETLRIKDLEKRVIAGTVKEVILALNPDIQGEGTIMYLKSLLKPYPIKISVLARGLSMGSEIEYADDATISNALRGRIT